MLGRLQRVVLALFITLVSGAMIAAIPSFAQAANLGTDRSAPQAAALSWHWSNQGTPSGGITDKIGTVTVRDTPTSAARPYAFVQAGDGNLWVNWWDGGAWQWSNQGQPPSGITAGLGAITVADGPQAAQRPYAFVRAGDGTLWVDWWSGSAWRWSSLGQPGGWIAAGVGAITVQDNPQAPQRPYVFVRTTDGNLWLDWWTGSAWQWSNQGQPSGGVNASVGAITVQDNPQAPQRPYVFVRAGDGNLWVDWWTGSSWQWSNQGQPAGGITAGIGAITVADNPQAAQRPYAFVRAGDGNLWVNWWTGASWQWSSLGQPKGGITEGIGAITVQDSPQAGQRPYVFVRAGDGNLWIDWWTGSSWQWSNQGQSAAGIVTGVGAITVADSPQAPQRPYVFVRAGDGNLWVNWWG